MSIDFLPGPIPLVCPECSARGFWFLLSESVMCDNCAHAWPWVEAYESAIAVQAEMKL